ncbi:glycogen debranching N-terminal domain-containing protein [Streptomyces sp. NPDC001480]|uniref:glycogen debranching N-terminal domain-containing protein n=1 Tax=Streptomyces sp. NPDC001480 TaxID=3364577 RepID=UPI0036B2A2B2
MTDEVGATIEETEPAVLTLTAATFTLVEGRTFCVSGTSDDMEAEVPQGLFFRDVRVISDWQLRGDGHRRTTSPCFPRTPEDLRLRNLSTRLMRPDSA